MTTTDTRGSARQALARDTNRAETQHANTGVPETAGPTAQGPTPDHILQIGTGFWASKTLLSAVELDLFTVLGAGPMTGHEIGTELCLNARSVADFLDSLVSLGLLARHGDGAQAHYANTNDTAAFLDSRSPAYLGGILEMLNSRLYGFWGDLTEALRTGQPQNEAKTDGGEFFDALYADEQRLEEFLRAMQGIQTGNFLALLDRIDLSSAATLCDLGGASGILCALAAQRHPHLRAITFDLPSVIPIAKRTLAAMNVDQRVTPIGGDFFVDELPSADVVVMGNVLHDWDNDHKQTLIRKAYASLTDGGRLIAIENVIDDARRTNTFGLLMSLNMLIETSGGSDYTGAQFDEWCLTAGFTRTEIVPLAGPTSAAIAYK
jgi:predicted O-methyltransferase YrrM